MSYEEQKKMAYENQTVGSSISRAEPIAQELSISVELKKLEETINEIENASQDFVNRVAPILFFGPEKACAGGEPNAPAGSDLARELFLARDRLMRTVIFLRVMSQKVNL